MSNVVSKSAGRYNFTTPQLAQRGLRRLCPPKAGLASVMNLWPFNCVWVKDGQGIVLVLSSFWVSSNRRSEFNEPTRIDVLGMIANECKWWPKLRVLKHGFEPPNCSDIFLYIYDILFKKKAWMRREVGPLRSGSPRRKSRTYRPTTSTYLVDLLEQQPATICSEKGKTRFYQAKPGFTMFYPSRLKENTVSEGEGIWTYTKVCN